MLRASAVRTLACTAMMVLMTASATAFASPVASSNSAATPSPTVSEPKVRYPHLKSKTQLPTEAFSPLPLHPEWHLIRTRTSTGTELRMYAKNCGYLGSLLGTLSQWRLRHGELTNPKPIMKTENDYCSVAIDKFLPSFVKPMILAHPAWHGPNSWNAVLVENGIVSQWRTSDDTELSYYLQSPVCRALTPIETPVLGDLGIIRTLSEGSRRPSHATAFVYLNEDMVFTKDESLFTSPWALQTPGFVLSLYGLDKELPRCRDKNNINNEGCPKALTYYRCRNLKSFAETTGWKPEPRVRALMTRITALEARVSDLILGKAPFSEKIAEDILNEHNRLFEESSVLETQIAEEGSTDDALWFYLGKNRLALVSLAYQVTSFFIGGNVLEPVKVWYRHEPWQGASLVTKVSPQTGPVENWLTCAPWSKPCQKPADLNPLPAPENSGFLKH